MKREARLKPAHARVYPGIAAGTWEPAAVLADKVLSCRLLLTSGGLVLYERALDADHFEFRGGEGARQSMPERLATDARASAADAALSSR